MDPANADTFEGNYDDFSAVAAESAGVTVVAFTETLPDGADHPGWMSGNIAAVAEAVD